MRVGIYIDGLNLYYGGRSIMGRSQPGWRWLDLRKLSQRLLDGSHAWLAQGATLHRIVYCTAFIEGSYNAQGRKNQTGTSLPSDSTDHSMSSKRPSSSVA